MTRSFPVPARGILYASILLATVPGPALAEPVTGLVYQTVTLDNGLQVITLEDFTAPVVNVQLWYHVGSKDEDPQRQGFAHMFEHMMFRGTDRLGPTDHFDLLRKTGGYTNAYTAFDQTVYHETVPANQLDLALWLEAERMAFLKIDQAAFDTERQVVEEERRMRVSQPYGMLPEKALAEIFKVHPYRWTPLGNITHLRAASVPELRAFWTRYYVPNNAVLVIVGAVRHEQAQAAARRYFGWIPRCPDPPRITVREPESKGRTLVFKEDNAPAPVVGIGGRTVPAGHPDEMALRLLTTILGGGESSRTYRRLVAGQELAVMTVGLSESIEHEGFIGFVAVLPPVGGKPEKALAELEAIIEQARNEPVDKRELDKARNNMLRTIVVENLTAEGRASTLGRMAVLTGDVSKVNARLEELRRLTPDDLQRVARKYLAPDRLFKATVERNLAGALSGWLGFKKKEEVPPVTARPETDPPPPGRPGLKRPEGFPATAPVGGQLAYDPTPRHESFALPNGLKVLVVENHKGPFITVTLGLRAGAWCEDKPGSAALAMGLLTKGSSRHSEAQLAEELERYAITLSGNGGMDGSNVYASCLTEHVDRAVRLMGEVILTPTFPEDEFRKLRDRVRASLVISTNEPAYAADREFRRRVFGGHPYARAASGEVADVDALTLEDVRGWWQRFARPDQAVLIFAGDIDLERARKLAEVRFGEWTARGEAPRVELPAVPPPEATHIYLVDRPGIQSQIRVGRGLDLSIRSPEAVTGQVVSGYFGGSFASRLNESIRVKKGLTYGARGGYNFQRFAGELRVSTFSKTAHTPRAVRAILEQVDRLRDEPPSDGELDKTKSFTLGSFPLQRETPQSVADDLWFIELFGAPKDYWQRLLAGVAATAAPDCMNLVKATVDPARLTIVVLGPAGELREELEKIAPVTVIPAGDAATKPAKEDGK